MTHYPFSGVVEHLHKRIAQADDLSFKRAAGRCSSRLSLAEHPEGARDGLYWLDVTMPRPHSRHFGAGWSAWYADATMELGYFWGDGDLAEGDRDSILSRAGTDLQHLADVVEHSDTYDGDNTGISEIKYASADLVKNEDAHLITLVLRWTVEWRSDTYLR